MVCKMITKTNSDDWKVVLKADPTAWLLEDSNPSVPYFTLTDILGAAEDDAEVKTARKAIMSSGIVPRILEKQNPDGSWGEPADFYLRCKYQGTVWTVILLAELGADGKDKRIQKAAEFIVPYLIPRPLGRGMEFSLHLTFSSQRCRATKLNQSIPRP